MNRSNNFIGIDPGYGRLGVAIVAPHTSGRVELIHAELIETDVKHSLAERLAYIQKELIRIIDAHCPVAGGVETIYMTKNTKTAIGVAGARGVVIASLARAHIPVLDITPNQVKLALTGHGGAEKTQVGHMVERILTTPSGVLQDDVMDAIAIAITAERLFRP
jgi:crossover junction endodeoxyribonuclease RuvC